MNYLLIRLTGIMAMVILVPSAIQAQRFVKGDKILDAGIEISIYSIHDKSKDASDTSGSSRAASYTVPIAFEYAFSDRIGAGVELGFCNYFTEEDSVLRTIATAGSFDLLLKGDFHWVRGGTIDLCSGLGLGFSAFHYESNDNVNSKYEATGFYFHLNVIQARFYLAKFIALNLHVGVPVMDFEEGRVTDDLGSDYSFPLSFAGVDLGTGVSFRF